MKCKVFQLHILSLTIIVNYVMLNKVYFNGNLTPSANMEKAARSLLAGSGSNIACSCYDTLLLLLHWCFTSTVNI